MAETLIVNPASYDTTNYKYASIASGYPLSNPVGKGSSGTAMCRINLTTGSGAETYVYYKFDLSAIPQNVTIDSVKCKLKTYISNTTSARISTRQSQLYYGTTTAKGDAGTISGSTTAYEIDGGSWTRSELNDCRLRLYGKRGTSYTGSTYYIGFYGADLTVTYTTIQGDKIMIKTSTGWKEATKVYKKMNGTWVEQTDLKNIFNNQTNYLKK